MHIKFAQYIQAQEIFARGGHCHRPKCTRLYLSFLSISPTLCVCLRTCAESCTSISLRNTRRSKKKRSNSTCTQIGYTYILLLLLCTCANVRFSVGCFYPLLFRLHLPLLPLPLHCDIVWVHKNQNYMFTLIVLSCVVLLRIVRDCHSRIYIHKTNWCIKRASLCVLQWAKKSKRGFVSCWIFFFFAFFPLRFHRERERIDNSDCEMHMQVDTTEIK